MTDIYDQATEHEERTRAALLKSVMNRRPEILAKGSCYNCQETLNDNDLFCDRYCRDDWELRNPRR